MRSLSIGLSTSIRFFGEGSKLQMQLTLEPDDGGDHQLATADGQLIEQVKLRNSSRRWSSPELARDVIPNLLPTARPGSRQQFKFVTNHDAGLAQLGRFLTMRSSSAADGLLKWKSKLVRCEQFERLLAEEAGVEAGDPRLAHLLDNLAIEIIETDQADEAVEALVKPLLAPGESAARKRRELAGTLFEAAAQGQTLSAHRLLSAVSEDAVERIALIQRLPAIARRQVEHVCANLAYDERFQARQLPLIPTGGLTILTGESGQGKTWSLCQAALAQIERRELSLLTSAPDSVNELVALINDHFWVCAYGQPTSLGNIQRRLAPYFADDQRFWLTLYIDDIQDRKLAVRLRQYDWRGVSIRLVVSCQPRITEVLAGGAEVQIQQIGDFSSRELRRFLERHGRDDPLETMPDDVFELLLKPIHARIFTELPAAQQWIGKTEYELFQAYWTQASLLAREQRDHRSDAVKLVDLARLIMASRPDYPWTEAQVHSTGMSDDALVRLEQVGLLRWERPSALAFSTDRMLNWAVAQAIVELILDEQLLPGGADLALAQLDKLETRGGDALGYRLGYVFMDALWLLCQRAPPDFVAKLLRARMDRRESGWRDRAMWQDQIATLGPAILPALRLLAVRSYNEREFEIPANLIAAAAAIGDTDAAAVARFVDELLGEGSENASDIAIGVASRISCPAALDRLWSVVLDRDQVYRDQRSDESDGRRKADSFEARNQAAKALQLAIAQHPEWLVERLREASLPHELELLLTALMSPGALTYERALRNWEANKARLKTRLPGDSYALATAIGHFRDSSMMDWLDSVPHDPKKFTSARVMHSRALVDPPGALQQIATAGDRYDWALADWWVADLAKHDAETLAGAIQKRAQQSDQPLVQTVLHYRNFPEAMTPGMLDWLLDGFATALEALNSAHKDEGEPQLGGLGHVLHFLARLNERWQLEQLARRANTPLETELVRWAISRPGRTSRYKDHDGSECERILAAIGGPGFEQLVLAKLNRADPFGREDGFELACWSESNSVRDALAAPNDGVGDSYRQVIRMEALAVHQCDERLEQMVREGSPIYVNAALMRGEQSRPAESLLARIRSLSTSDQAGEALIAARLAGFLPDEMAAAVLLPLFVRDGTNSETRMAIVATLRAAGFYDPYMLEGVVGLLTGPDRDSHFVAFYLARFGDAAARAAVIDWMALRDLGNGSVADRSYLHALTRHDDSRPAVIDFLLRSRANGHLLHESWQLELLADADDRDAQQRLTRASYRKPDFGEGMRVAAIRHVERADPQEAFFCARRMWAMQRSPVAIGLMLDIDSAKALPLLLNDYPRACYSERIEIARRLRNRVPQQTAVAIISLAQSASAAERRAAAELAGWLPSNVECDWLRPMAADGEHEVVAAARNALERRRKEDAALEHLRLMHSSTKSQRWVRMRALFELVDPYLLWRREDPVGLGSFFEEQPHEFFVEAEQIKKARERELEQETRRFDRDGR